MSTPPERYKVRALTPPTGSPVWSPTTYVVVDTETGMFMKHCFKSGVAWLWAAHLNDPRYPAPSPDREALSTAS